MSRSQLRSEARFAALVVALCAAAGCGGDGTDAAPGRCNDTREVSPVTVITQGRPLFTAVQDGCGPWRPLPGTDTRFEFSTAGRYALAIVCPERWHFDGYASVNIIQATAAEGPMLVTDLCPATSRPAATASVEVTRVPGESVFGELAFWIGLGGQHWTAAEVAPGTYDVVYLQYRGTSSNRGPDQRIRIDRGVALAAGKQALDPRFADTWHALEPAAYSFEDADGTKLAGMVRSFGNALVTAGGTYIPLDPREYAPAAGSTLAVPAATLTAGDQYRLEFAVAMPEGQWKWWARRHTQAHLASLTDVQLRLPPPLPSARVWVVDQSRLSASFAPYPGATLYTVDYVLFADPSLSFLTAAFADREDPAKARAIAWRTTTSAGWLGETSSYTVSAPTSLAGWRTQWNVPPFGDGYYWTASVVTSNRPFGETLAPRPAAGLVRQTVSIAGFKLK
jgi:hypothetical protein